MADVVTRIKDEVGLAVTLSLGERPDADLELWRAAGADRYLLRFETSDDALYKLIHPDLPGRPSDRFAILRTLRRLGYEPGSGIMVGIPGQTWDSVADDITAFRDLDLDMIGVKPYISHPATPLGDLSWAREVAPGEQITSDGAHRLQGRRARAWSAPRRTYRARRLLPRSTRSTGASRDCSAARTSSCPTSRRRSTACATGYPDKACVNETAEMCRGCLQGRIEAIGREVGSGPGGRRRA